MTRANGWAGGTGRMGFNEQLHHLWRTRPRRLPRQGPVAGVAAGFGRRYGVDPVLVRVVFVVASIFGGAGVVLYLAAWLILPAAGDQVSAGEGLLGKGQSSQSPTRTVVLIVALAIAVTTMGPVGVGLGGSGLISFALMLAGWWLLYLRQPEPPADDYQVLVTEGGLGSTGYPGAMFPGGAPWAGPTYGPFTRLPDQYEPDPKSPPAQGFPPDDTATEVIRRPQPDTSDTPASTEAVYAAPSPATGINAEPNAVPSTDQATEALPNPTSNTGAKATTDTSSSPADTEVLATSPTDAGTESNPAADGEDERHSLAPTDATRDADTDSDGGAGVSAASGDTEVLKVPSGTERPAPHRTAARPTGDRPTRTAPGPARPGLTPPGWDPLGVAPLAWDLPEPGPARPVAVLAPPPPRPRSRLTPTVIGLAVLAAAVAGAFAAWGAEWMTPGRIGAVALAVVGLGLIVGAFLRRGHGLMVVLAPLAGFVILASMAGPVEFDRGAVGDHVWTPATVADLQSDYRVNMGSGTLDLRSLALTENRTVDVSVRMGDVRVLVPENMRLQANCSSSMGDLTCPRGLTGPAEGPVLTLNVDVRAGDAEVKRG
ncbi:PspC domain-containing protein [Nocardia blacklockiae]|uniref:PspC domain-containing protein n=1 Tax=Nocardia blacklockiae TaxID=480036 RepID=UPI001892F7F9|nr:PspC domain-containing protein [Nocardia blacklockiae]MBF6172578.1 PspC domain-containing protein [Nocardia blacklockiae]